MRAPLQTLGSGMASLAIALFMPSAAFGQAQQPEKESGSAKAAVGFGTISGRVALQDGRPADGVLVYVRASDGPAAQVLTDAEGNFSATAVAGKSYVVDAEFPGYLRARSIGPVAPGYRIEDKVSLTLLKGGVVTGRVTTENGEPVVGLPVALVLVRRDGLQFPPWYGAGNGLTDDRGIYRFFGLAPGGYLVVANSPYRRDNSTISGFEQNLAVYYPSSSQADATEVIVEAGREVSGIDIRFRKERGYSVLGNIERKPESGCAAMVELLQKSSGQPFSYASAREGSDGCSFAFDGIPDGEYGLVATQGLGQDQMVASEERRIAVKGADVSGIRLALSPLGSIYGRVIYESLADSSRPAECKAAPILPERTRIAATIARKKGDIGPGSLRFQSASSSPTSTGGFVLNRLAPGTFTLAVSSAEARWYVKSITMPATPRGVINVGRDGIALKSGENVTGVAITLTEGAGSVMGNIRNYAGDARARWRLFLVPKENAFAEDVFRYRLATIDDISRFYFNGVPPGQYWLVARPRSDDRSQTTTASPAMWDSSERVRLRKEGETAANLVEVKSCQTIQGYSMILPSPDR